MSSPVSGGAKNERADPPITQQPKDNVTQAMTEQKAQARSGELLQATDHLHQSRDKALLPGPGQLQPAPALRQPNLLAVGYCLKSGSTAMISNTWCRAAGWQPGALARRAAARKDREALLPEELDQTAQRLLALASEPAVRAPR